VEVAIAESLAAPKHMDIIVKKRLVNMAMVRSFDVATAKDGLSIISQTAKEGSYILVNQWAVFYTDFFRTNYVALFVLLDARFLG